MDCRNGTAARAPWFLLLSGMLLLPACSSPTFPDLDAEPTHSAGVTEKETRFFAISVDGKKAGQYRMAITSRPDGTLSMAGQARVKISFVIYSYTYNYEGTETYRQGRLAKFHSHANDNGKEFEVSAQARGKNLHLQVNGATRTVSPQAWITSYWQLPPGPGRDRSVVLLDADTGKVMEGKLRHVEDKPLPVAGTEQACAHYQLTGPPSPVDLWYDGQQRLVRQEFVEDGHRTVLRMMRVIHRQIKEPSAPRAKQTAPARQKTGA